MINTMIIKKSEFRSALIKNGFGFGLYDDFSSMDKILDKKIMEAVDNITKTSNPISIRYASIDDIFIIDLDACWFSLNDILCACGGCSSNLPYTTIVGLINSFNCIDYFYNKEQFIIVKVILEKFHNRVFTVTSSDMAKRFYQYLPGTYKVNHPLENCDITAFIDTKNDYNVKVMINNDYIIIAKLSDDGKVDRIFIGEFTSMMNGEMSIGSKEPYYYFLCNEMQVSQKDNK